MTCIRLRRSQAPGVGDGHVGDCALVDPGLKALGAEVEVAPGLDEPLAARVAQALAAAGHCVPRGFGSVDAVLAGVAAALPGWAVSMDGRASVDHGDWTCTIRRSRLCDNDDAVGVGRGNHAGPALLGALLKALAAGARP